MDILDVVVAVLILEQKRLFVVVMKRSGISMDLWCQQQQEEKRGSRCRWMLQKQELATFIMALYLNLNMNYRLDVL